MCAEDEIHGVMAKTILCQRDLSAHASELVPEVPRLVKESQRMHIANGLHDAEVDFWDLGHDVCC